MSFSFGFADDEDDHDENSGVNAVKSAESRAHETLAPVKEHSLEELVGKNSPAAHDEAHASCPFCGLSYTEASADLESA